MIAVVNSECDSGSETESRFIVGKLILRPVAPQSSVTPPCNQGNQTLTKSVQNYAVQGSSCESCQKDHRLYLCSQFKGMCLADIHEFVKDKNFCFNCFQSGHSSDAFPCKFTCPECKMKHYTLLECIDFRNSSLINTPQV